MSLSCSMEQMAVWPPTTPSSPLAKAACLSDAAEEVGGLGVVAALDMDWPLVRGHCMRCRMSDFGCGAEPRISGRLARLDLSLDGCAEGFSGRFEVEMGLEVHPELGRGAEV